MGEQIEELIKLYRALGAKNSFREIALFNFGKKPYLNESQVEKKRLAKLFREHTQRLRVLEIETLLECRLHIFADHKTQIRNVFKRFKLNNTLLNAFPEEEIPIFTQAYLNIIDFMLFHRITTDRSHKEFHVVKEYLYNCEDYRDQIELFMDFRIPYQHEGTSDILQHNLANEFKLISEYTHQLFHLYEAAMEYIENRQQA